MPTSCSTRALGTPAVRCKIVAWRRFPLLCSVAVRCVPLHCAARHLSHDGVALSSARTAGKCKGTEIKVDMVITSNLPPQKDPDTTVRYRALHLIQDCSAWACVCVGGQHFGPCRRPSPSPSKSPARAPLRPAPCALCLVPCALCPVCDRCGCRPVGRFVLTWCSRGAHIETCCRTPAWIPTTTKTTSSNLACMTRTCTRTTQSTNTFARCPAAAPPPFALCGWKAGADSCWQLLAVNCVCVGAGCVIVAAASDSAAGSWHHVSVLPRSRCWLLARRRCCCRYCRVCMRALLVLLCLPYAYGC